MKKMIDIYKIRLLYFNEKLNYSQISRECGIARRTVRKIIENNIIEPVFIKREVENTIGKNYEEKVKDLLEQNKGNNVTLTAARVYSLLKEHHDYTGSYESVNNIMNKFKDIKQANNAFIPLDFPPGESFEFDWGTNKVNINENEISVKTAIFVLCYSRLPYIRIYPNETSEMLLDAHDRAFEFFKGCTKNGLYDNMKTAISKILIGKDRIINKSFVPLASHYKFKVVACTPSSGWEKGRVEKKVNDTRRNFFAPMLKGQSFEDINQQLEDSVLKYYKEHKHPEFKNKTVYDVYLEELPSLNKFDCKFNAFRIKSSVVSPLSTINFETNRYSVPTQYVGKAVLIKILPCSISVEYDSKEIATHKRVFERNKQILFYRHYIPLLKIKPGALRNGSPFNDEQYGMPKELFMLRKRLGETDEADREFSKILLLSLNYEYSLFLEACQQALNNDLLTASVIESYLKPLSINLKETIDDKMPSIDVDCKGYSKLLLTGDENE